MPKYKRGRHDDASDGGSEELDNDIPKTKKAKNSALSKKTTEKSSGKNDKGEPYWELCSSTRRVTVTKYSFSKAKEMVRIDIREFYEKDGEHLPGKKGISLTVEQFNALLKAIPYIAAATAKDGEELEGFGTDAVDNNDMDAGPPKKIKPKLVKSNIEATSDEDEE